MIKSTRILVTVLAFTCLSIAFWPIHAQITKRKTEPVKGTVVSIEKAKVGKSYNLQMKAEDGTEYAVPIVPRTILMITAKGDSGFFKSGSILRGMIYQIPEVPTDYVTAEFTVCLGTAAPPKFSFVPHPDDETAVEMAGKIVAIRKMPDGQKGSILSVTCGAQPFNLSYFADDSEINLNLADPTFIKEGDAIEVDGTIIKSKKQITAKTVTVKSAEPITSADYFAAIEDSKKSKASKSTATKSKSKTDTKTKDEPNSAGKDGEPLGVLKTKKSTKPKTEESETPSDAKKDDAKDSGKKGE